MTQDLKAGQKVIFTETNEAFILKEVTEKRVSWYVNFTYKGGTGKNTLRTAWTSRKVFLEGIADGSYKLID